MGWSAFSRGCKAEKVLGGKVGKFESWNVATGGLRIRFGEGFETWKEG